MKTATAALAASLLSLSLAPTAALALEPSTTSTAVANVQNERETLLEGTFEGREGKRGRGTARIVREGSNHFLEFEGFRTSRGPQLEVWITDQTVRTNADVQHANAIELGGLQSPRESSQRYELPADFDVSTAKGVVIWCEPFAILFASADLS